MPLLWPQGAHGGPRLRRRAHPHGPQRRARRLVAARAHGRAARATAAHAAPDQDGERPAPRHPVVCRAGPHPGPGKGYAERPGSPFPARARLVAIQSFFAEFAARLRKLAHLHRRGRRVGRRPPRPRLTLKRPRRSLRRPDPPARLRPLDALRHDHDAQRRAGGTHARRPL